MLPIIEFYFRTMGQIITDVWGKFEIFPGISYGYWIMGIGILTAIISLITFNSWPSVSGYLHNRREADRRAEYQKLREIERTESRKRLTKMEKAMKIK